MTLIAGLSFVFAMAALGLTFHRGGPIWLVLPGFLISVASGAAMLIGVMPWLWRAAAM